MPCCSKRDPAPAAQRPLTRLCCAGTQLFTLPNFALLFRLPGTALGRTAPFYQEILLSGGTANKQSCDRGPQDAALRTSSARGEEIFVLKP